eukprot:GFYU01007080.1.p1 GENE.GFYU01007080.1~~GFYU01007080.1.p1  ORF type:complete len:818 (+),score=272.16 GFYU01007080.1:105-2558(+)
MGDGEVPDGIFPLFLTATTQQMFALEGGENPVTKDDYMRYIPKADILKDIQFRGAISDFHAVKKKLEEWKQDDVLVCFDDDEIYGENYYVVYTVEAKEMVEEEYREKNKPPEEDELEGGGEGGEVKKQRPAEWIPCSEASFEIKEAKFENTRERVVYHMNRPRRTFGVPHARFQARDAQDYIYEFPPFKDPNFDLRKMEIDNGTQAVPEMKTATCQTTWFRPVNAIVQYEPNEEMTNEEEAQYADDPSQNPRLEHFLATVQKNYHESLEQNETLNIFHDDFTTLADEDTALGNEEESIIKELHSFSDLDFSQDKRLAAIAWHPKEKGVVAVSCVKKWTFLERCQHAGKVIKGHLLVWNFLDPIIPQFVLETPTDILTFKFNPTNPDIIACGCYNGQVCLYDLGPAHEELRRKERNKSRGIAEDDESNKKKKAVITYTMMSSIEHGHKRPVSDLVWLQGFCELNNKGKPTRNEERQTLQFATICADGQVLIWDTRADEITRKGERKAGSGQWIPIFRVLLSRPDAPGEMVAAQLSLTNILKRGSVFYATSEDGLVACCDLTPDDEGKLPQLQTEEDKKNLPQHVKWISHAHYGPCVALDRSPFFDDILLSAGSWTFAIWKEGIETPIFVSSRCHAYLTSARWSPVRPGVIITATADGAVGIWDLTDRSHEPSHMITVNSSGITSLEFTNNTESGLLAVGDNQGILHILEPPKTIRRSLHADEKNLMANFFEREVVRIEYSKQRAEYHQKEKEKREAAASKEEEKEGEDKDSKAEIDEEFKKAETAYRQMEEAFRKELGMDVKEDEEGGAPAADAPPGR